MFLKKVKWLKQTTQQELSRTQRMRWVDYAKGIGIFLVVLGHVLIGLVNGSILKPSTAFFAVEQWIYAFHMPLFFFLSGLFIHRSASKRLTDFVVDKFRGIAYPYVLWSLLQSILQAATSRHTNHPVLLTDLWRIIYQPVLQFWFFYALFIMMMAYAVVYKLGISSGQFLLFSIIFYCIKGRVNLGSWLVLDQLQTYTMYLALGALVGSGPIMPKLRLLNPRILLIIMSSGFLAVGLAVGCHLITDIYEHVPIIALFGIAASLALAILMEQFNLVPFVEMWGALSLQIYVAHTVAAAMLRIVLQKFSFVEPITHVVVGTAVGINVPIGLEMICQRVGFWYMFTLSPKKSSKALS